MTQLLVTDSDKILIASLPTAEASPNWEGKPIPSLQVEACWPSD